MHTYDAGLAVIVTGRAWLKLQRGPVSGDKAKRIRAVHARAFLDLRIRAQLFWFFNDSRFGCKHLFNSEICFAAQVFPPQEFLSC